MHQHQSLHTPFLADGPMKGEILPCQEPPRHSGIHVLRGIHQFKGCMVSDKRELSPQEIIPHFVQRPLDGECLLFDR